MASAGPGDSSASAIRPTQVRWQIVGLLMGSGLFSGLGSLAGIFGLLIQLALIGGLVWLAVAFWRRR